MFHCAADVRTWGPRQDFWAANVVGLANLLEAFSLAGTLPGHLVHFSSVDVYGFPSGPAPESSRLQPTGFGYGDSKQAGEQLLRARAAALGLSYTILRPCNVMGAGSPFIDRIGRKLRSGLMFRVGDGRVHCGYLDVDNLVDVALWAARSPAAGGETFNVRDPMDLDWRTFLHDLRQALQGRGTVLSLPYGVAMASARVLSGPYRVLHLRQEPLLHPLLVQIFGRTCGHSIDKIRAAGAPLGRVSYTQSLASALAV